MIEGYRGVKDYRYSSNDSGTVHFGIVDQKGRAIGYKWNIYRVDLVVMTDAEYAASKACGIVKIGEPTTYIEMRTTVTRDDIPYGPSVPRIQCETLEQACEARDKRIAAARKANAKKFAAFNVTENAG